MKFTLHSLAALAVGFSCFAVAAEPPKIVMEEFMVPSKEPGIRLYVRNKHPEGAKKFSAGKILLFVHGATYPAETSFDLQLNGQSWMDYIARRGYDVYLVDVRGPQGFAWNTSLSVRCCPAVFRCLARPMSNPSVRFDCCMKLYTTPRTESTPSAKIFFLRSAHANAVCPKDVARQSALARNAPGIWEEQFFEVM